MNRRLGHTIEIASLDDPSSPWLEKLGVKVHALGPGSGIYGFSSRYIPWLRENAKNYDCVVINGIWGYNCFGTWQALRGINIPYFVFTHGMLDPWFKYRYPFKHLKKWLYWPWGVFPALRDAQCVFFTCEEERRLARQSFWLYDCQEFVLPYGTDGADPDVEGASESFLLAHPSLRNKRLILFLGRVHPKKGPDLLIEATRLAITEGLIDRENFRVVMAGPASGEYASKLKALISKHGLDEVFYWTGMILGDQKWGAYEIAEAFILPSHQENFGLSVAEALSAGTPVLIGKGVNIWPEIVKDGAGFAEPDTIEGTLALLRAWIGLMPAEKLLMSENARNCYLKRFTANQAANSFVAAVYLFLGTWRDRRKPHDITASL